MATTTNGDFKPEEHLTNIKGKQYLEVKWRLVWFREDHPLDSGWGIRTIPEELTDSRAVYRAQVVSPEGAVIAEGTKSETPGGFADYIEKAETGAIGRALAICGYGTQFCGEELDEGARIVDSPVARPADQPKGSAKPPADADKAQPASGNGKTFGDLGVEWFDRLLAEYPPETQIAVRAQLPTFLKGFRVESLKALPYLKKQDIENWAKAKAKAATPQSVSEAEQAEIFFARRKEAEDLGIPTEGLTTVEALAEEIAKVRKSQEVPA